MKAGSPESVWMAYGASIMVGLGYIVNLYLKYRDDRTKKRETDLATSIATKSVSITSETTITDRNMTSLEHQIDELRRELKITKEEGKSEVKDLKVSIAELATALKVEQEARYAWQEVAQRNKLEILELQSTVTMVKNEKAIESMYWQQQLSEQKAINTDLKLERDSLQRQLEVALARIDALNNVGGIETRDKRKPTYNVDSNREYKPASSVSLPTGTDAVTMTMIDSHLNIDVPIPEKSSEVQN